MSDESIIVELMSAELKNWCENNSMPYQSADELLALVRHSPNIPNGHKVYCLSYLQSFIDRWETVVNSIV